MRYQVTPLGFGTVGSQFAEELLAWPREQYLTAVVKHCERLSYALRGAALWLRICVPNSRLPHLIYRDPSPAQSSAEMQGRLAQRLAGLQAPAAAAAAWHSGSAADQRWLCMASVMAHR